MALWDKFISSTEKDEKRAKELWDSAQKYFESKLYNRALKDMGEALTLKPALYDEALDLMQALSGSDDDEMAISVGAALLKIDPKNTELVNKLGNSLRKLNSFPKAKKLYTTALKINPQFAEAKYNLAACSFRIITSDNQLVGQTQKVEKYTEVRRYGFQGSRADFFPVPNQELEEDHSSKKDEEKPEEEVSEEQLAQRAEGLIQTLKGDMESSGSSWQAVFNLALLYDMLENGELAIQNYRKAVEVEPENRKSANNLAVALMAREQDIPEAETILLKNLGTHRYDRTTVLNLALLYRRLNKGFQTLKYFVYLGDLLDKSLGDFETEKVEEFAKNLFERRKYLEAVPVFENLGKEKQAVFWFEKLVVMYLNQKKEDKVVETFKRLLKIDPEHKEAAKKLTEMATKYEEEAREKMAKGSRPQAVELMLKAANIEETAERWVEVAQLYEDMGEEILAQNALSRWKKLSGEETPAAGGQTKAASAQ